MAHLGLKYLTAIVESGDVQAFVKLRLPRKMFKAIEIELYDFIDQHVRKYGAIPAASTIEKNLGDDVFEPVEEPPAFYADEVQARYIADSLKQHIKDVRAHLTQDNMDPYKAFDIARTSVSDLQVTTNHQSILDFRDSRDVVIKEYKQKLTEGDDHGFYTGWPTLDNMTQGLGGGDVMSIVGRPAMGKLAPTDTPVLTPTGWSTMGDLKPGSYVIGKNGKPTKVLAIHPQGQKQAYRVTFKDQTSTECGIDHLWRVAPDGGRNRNKWRTLTLGEILEKGVTQYKHGRHGAKWRIPVVDPVDFSDKDLPVDPYVLGTLLGDGCLTSPNTLALSNPDMDSDIREQLSSRLPKGITYRLENYGGCPRLKFDNPKMSGFWGVLSGLGVCVKSKEKFIPEMYFTAGIQQRFDLLRGLMDTNGHCSQSNSTTFHTCAPRLAKDVAALARSLGGTAQTFEYDRQEADKPVEWQVRIRMNQCPFYTKRKASRWKPVEPTKYIWSVEESRVTEQVCITVENEDCLYVTEDYIVTHNTWKLLYSGHNAWKNHGKRVMLISMEMASTILAQRVISMHSHVALTQLKSAKLSKPLFDKMKAGFKEIEGYDQPFWIIDGNLTATTVDDVTLLAHQLKPDVILIDGAYLLRHPKIQRKHDRVDANAELIKYQLSSALDVPVVASYQFNREAAKLSKSKQEDVGLEHIGLTDSIGQLSSVVTGLFEDESIETIKRRWVQVLKGRSGETGGFYINWNFQMMDFDENDPSDEAEALQHL